MSSIITLQKASKHVFQMSNYFFKLAAAAVTKMNLGLPILPYLFPPWVHVFPHLWSDTLSFQSFLLSCVPLYHLMCWSPPSFCASLLFHVFFMYVILLSTVFSSFLIPSVYTFLSFLPYSCSSSHPFFLASSTLSCLFCSISLLVYFLPIIYDCFVAPPALVVTFHPSFNLSFCGWSIRSRCPGGRWEMVDVWFPKDAFKICPLLNHNTTLANYDQF